MSDGWEHGVAHHGLTPRPSEASWQEDESDGVQWDGVHPALEREILAALKTVRDPEIPVNLVDLGLIYRCAVRIDGIVSIEMTLTTPACPVAGALPGQVQNIVSLVPGVSAVLVQLVWDPPWSRERMTEAARLELGLL